MTLPKNFNRLGSLSVAGLQLFTFLPVLANNIIEEPLTESSVQTVSSIKAYGTYSPYFSAFQEHLQAKNTSWQAARLASQLIYINTRFPLAPEQENDIRSALASGYIVIMDSTESTDKTEARNISAALGGIGFESVIIMLKKPAGETPEYKELSPYDRRNDNARNLDFSAPVFDHAKLALETDLMLESWGTPSKKNRMNGPGQYHPEVSIPVEIRYTGYPCMVGSAYHTKKGGYWDDEMIDACDNNASVSIFYTVDLIHSISPTAGNADDAKYIRITVDPSSNGGAGWHLSDKPVHKHTWFQTWANRQTWFGPIADSYYVNINSKDPDVHLYNTIPRNHPKESQIAHTVGFQVGVNGGPTILSPEQIGKYNPIGFAGLSMGLSFSYSSERSISYNNREYELINLSRAGQTDKAAWVWSREFDKYAQHWRTRKTGLVGCKDWFFDDMAFSAAAYSSFTPGFSATFKVPGSKLDTSTIEFESAVKVVALAGRVQYAFLYQKFSSRSMKGTKYSFKQNIAVNWGSTFFNPELPVSIEAYKENSEDGVCLEVIDSNVAEGSQVGTGDCHFNKNQIWGMDTEYRYKSFLAQDRCLTRENYGTLTIQPCTYAANQKWEWDNDHLVNNLGHVINLSEDKAVVVSPLTSTSTEWRSFLRKPDVAGTMTVSALSVTTDQPEAVVPQLSSNDTLNDIIEVPSPEGQEGDEAHDEQTLYNTEEGVDEETDENTDEYTDENTYENTDENTGENSQSLDVQQKIHKALSDIEPVFSDLSLDE